MITLKDRPLAYTGLSYALTSSALILLQTPQMRFRRFTSRILRRAVVLVILLIVSLPVLISAISLPRASAASVVRIYDVRTREQILRPFELQRPGQGLSSHSNEISIDEHPFDPSSQWTVICRGFKRLDGLPERHDDELVFLLTRIENENSDLLTESYQSVISPNKDEARNALAVTEREIVQEVQLNSKPPGRVTFIIHNAADVYLDLFLIPLVATSLLDPSEAQLHAEVHQSQKPFYFGPCPPGWTHWRRPFSVPKAAFIACGSSKGRNAVVLRRMDRLVTWGALYQKDICILEVEQETQTSELKGVFRLFERNALDLPPEARTLLEKLEKEEP